MKSIPTNITETTEAAEERKILKVTEEAHTALDTLTKLLREERKGTDVTYIDAASFAILELTERKMKAKERRLARTAELTRNTRRPNRQGVTA